MILGKREQTALTVGVGRQRLERIEQLTGIDVASADLLALELAIKLSRLTPAG